MLIKGCIGFAHSQGKWYGEMLLVRGKCVIEVPLPWPVYIIMKRLWKRENILGKFLFDKPKIDFQSLAR